jgi:hypothetical protein
MIVNNEEEGIQTEVVVLYFKVLRRHFTVEVEITYEETSVKVVVVPVKIKD